MRVEFRKSFARDLRKLRDPTTLKRIGAAIKELEAAHHLSELANLKKMSGGSSFYRIRVGDYRLGAVLEGDGIELVRCLHRRDIYRYFP